MHNMLTVGLNKTFRAPVRRFAARLRDLPSSLAKRDCLIFSFFLIWCCFKVALGNRIPGATAREHNFARIAGWCLLVSLGWNDPAHC